MPALPKIILNEPPNVPKTYHWPDYNNRAPKNLPQNTKFWLINRPNRWSHRTHRKKLGSSVVLNHNFDDSGSVSRGGPGRCTVAIGWPAYSGAHLVWPRKGPGRAPDGPRIAGWAPDGFRADLD